MAPTEVSRARIDTREKEPPPTMETTLHQQLKQIYAPSPEHREVRVGRYRIDATRAGRLIEIQLASLSAIRSKVADLLTDHDVTIVKPIVRRRLLVKVDPRRGVRQSQRWSPKRGQFVDMFHELLYFTRVFPHARLGLEVLLIDLEEHRVPCPPRRRRRWSVEHQVADQKLLEIVDRTTIKTADDLWRILPQTPALPFDTATLATALQVDRWFAQRIAYVLKHCGTIVPIGKRQRSWLYKPRLKTQTSA